MAKTKAVDHDIGSGLTTAGWSAGKWAVGGALLSGLVVAGLAVSTMMAAGGVGALVLSLGSSSTAGFSLATFAAGATGMLAGPAAVVTTAVAAITGVIGVAWGAIPAAVGACVGLIRGGNRAGREKQAYQEKIAQRLHKGDAKLEQVQLAAAQQGYMQGVADGQQHIVNQLQQAQEQMLLAQAKGSHADKLGKPCASKTEALAKQRESQPAAGLQA